MDQEQFCDYAFTHADFLFLGGSHAYGTNHEGSDQDIRGFFRAPAAVITAPFLDYRRDILKLEDHDDTVLWELGTFMQKAPNSPDMLDALFVPADSILMRNGKPQAYSDRYRLLRKHRDQFLSMAIVESLTGHARRDLHVLRKQRLLFEKGIEKPCQIDFLYMDSELSVPLRDQFPGAEDSDLLLRKLSSSDEVKIKNPEHAAFALVAVSGGRLLHASGDMIIQSASRYREQGEKIGYVYYDAGAFKRAQRTYRDRMKSPGRSSVRSEREKRFGFDTKTAANALRESRMAMELATTGEYRVRRSDADELRAIILEGARGYEDIQSECESLMEKTRLAIPRSDLPRRIDHGGLTGLYFQAYDMSRHSLVSQPTPSP